jgi:hypothetical protein
MKTTFLLASALALVLAGGAARAQAPTAPPTKEASPAKRAPENTAKRAGVTPAADKGETSGDGHGKHGGMGMGHAGMMMGGGMEDSCPMMAAHDATMRVTNTPTGVTITMTAPTAEGVAKLQKMAEGMQAKHDAHGK